MGRTSKYYPSRVFSCQRHICTTLTRKLSVAGHGSYPSTAFLPSVALGSLLTRNFGCCVGYYPSRAFSYQRHICTTLTRKFSVACLGTVVLFNEFREFSEFSELGCIRRSHPKLSKFPIFRNQCCYRFVVSSFCRRIFTTDSFTIYI